MEERIQYLLRKYLDNTSTKQEFDELFACLENLEDNSPLKESLQQVIMEPPVRLTAKKRKPWMIPVAASILVMATALTWFYFSPEERTPQPTIAAKTSLVKKSTERSEFKYLLLPDSTQVWLNVASTLEYSGNFNVHKREVVLKGEAYFDVKENSKKPFIIYSGKVSTVVLGTAFNIKAYPGLEKITVMVKKGKVKVSYDNKDVALLTQGQQVSISNSNRTVNEKQLKDEETNTWHDGILSYDDYALKDILADLERIYNVTIKMEAAPQQRFRVSTAFKREQGVETALEILCKLTDTKFKLVNGVYTIQ